MDATDIAILQQLMLDCRRPLREIAEVVGMSISAVHKRLTTLEESGVVRGYSALVNPELFGATVATLYGPCERAVDRATRSALGADPRVFQVVSASSNTAYVVAVTEKAGEVDDLVALVSDAIGMAAEVGVVDLADWGACAPRELSDLERAIAATLRHRGRMPIAQLAAATGATERETSRVLAGMIDRSELRFLVDYDPTATPAPWTMLHLELAGPRALGPLMQLAGPVTLGMTRFKDRPGAVHLFVWSPTLSRLDELTEQIRGLDAVESVMPSQVVAGEFYPIWIEERLGLGGDR